MPYTPPTTSPVVTTTISSIASRMSSDSSRLHPSSDRGLPASSPSDLLPPALHPQSPPSSVLYLNGPAGLVPRSASFLHKQKRNSPQKPRYYTKQNQHMFEHSTVASANAAFASDRPSQVLAPSTRTINNPPVQHQMKPSACHIESSDLVGDVDDEDLSSITSASLDEEEDEESVDGRSRSPSAQNIIIGEGDDDDSKTVIAESTSREIQGLAELQQAIRLSMPEPRRQASPTREDDKGQKSYFSPPLTTSHSMIDLSSASAASNSGSEFVSTFEDTDEEEHTIPRMVRKKSGELVKPSLKSRRPSSAPSTPTYPKNVHFDTHLEHVRHFLQAERPTAVSNQASPVDEHDLENSFPWLARPGASLEMNFDRQFHKDSMFGYNGQDVDEDFDDGFGTSSSSDEIDDVGPETVKAENILKPSFYGWELVLPNFPILPSQNSDAMVYTERIFLSADRRSLLGHVAVKNIAFSKWVAVKFTVDYWKTVSQVTAEYTDLISNGSVNRYPRPRSGYDRFTFAIKLQDFSKLEQKVLFFCVQYSVNGQEFWDNNNGANYQVQFKRNTRANQWGNSGSPKSSRGGNVRGGHTRSSYDFGVMPRRLSDSDMSGGVIPSSFTASTMPNAKVMINGSPATNGSPKATSSHYEYNSGRGSNKGQRPPRPDALDYSFESIYSQGKNTKVDIGSERDNVNSANSRGEASLMGNSSTGGQLFRSRYDFRQSLNAVLHNASVEAGLSSGSSPVRSSSSKDAVNSNGNTSAGGGPGFAFSTGQFRVMNDKQPENSSEESQQMKEEKTNRRPYRQMGFGPSTEELRHVNDQLARLRLEQNGTDKSVAESMSYQDFLDQFCFFQGPQRSSTTARTGTILGSRDGGSTSDSLDTSPEMVRDIL
ncbi:putative phosphatase regulatory subunit-domain-containing protein [Lipomyces oligophaga]|uniref:putative phosphatase regulatory subunit-domain-containing protein n=1 Tax=Lipomyces oligophaga TaxID=45792 RepID=UPI0034CDCDEA